MTPDSRVRLLEVEPDLGAFLNETERVEARSVGLPVVHLTAREEDDIGATLVSHRAFGALLLDGMILQRLRVGEQAAARLLGPGDILVRESTRATGLLHKFGKRTLADTRLAILGQDFMLAARRWPGLIAGLHIRCAEQNERVGAQLVICQMPRVADRVLAMMWLLAETWGRMTTAGVTLPMILTHESLGAMIGARRPTVSLALAELIDRGAVVRQRDAWLLLERIPDVPDAGAAKVAPVLIGRTDSVWSEPAETPDPYWAGSELLEHAQRLRDEVEDTRQAMRLTLADVRASVGRVRRRRAQAAASVSPPRAPSS